MDEDLQRFYWRDEILQIMYWLHGEGLGETVDPRGLMPFLELSEEAIGQVLETMAEEGYVTRLGTPDRQYRLTDFGLVEGKRHFAAEFAGLTHQGHGECNNPDYACHTLGPEACERQQTVLYNSGRLS